MTVSAVQSSGRHEIARKALETMENLGVDPSPENFFLWSHYAAGGDGPIAQDVHRLIEKGDPISAHETARLFDKHFTHAQMEAAVLAAGGKMAAQLGDVAATLHAAGRNTRAYGATLEGASGTLSKTNDPETLKEMIGELTVATKSMQRHSQALEQRLQATSREVEQLRSNLNAVRKDALTDGLTGVANRKRFDEVIASAVASAQANGAPLTLLMGDIDFFKKFNDTWGHQTGDQIIRFVATLLSRSARPDHTVARYGGEEFAVIMPATNTEDAAALAERMRAAIEGKKLLRKSTNEDLGTVTISLGIAKLQQGEAVPSLIERADTALYASKQAGRNRVTIAAEAPLAEAV